MLPQNQSEMGPVELRHLVVLTQEHLTMDSHMKFASKNILKLIINLKMKQNIKVIAVICHDKLNGINYVDAL